MTIRLAQTLFDQPIIRPSARVKAVAEMLGDHPSHIRKMIKNGDLEAHRQGKRGVRVFLDSVEAYQREKTIRAATKAGAVELVRKKIMSGATKAAHRHAMATLESLGLIRTG